MDRLVTVVGGIAGVFLMLNALPLVSSSGIENKWPAVAVLGIGAFLLVGSQYKTIKVSKDGIEAVRRDVINTAEAAKLIQEQASATAAALKATQAQLAQLATGLENQNMVPVDYRGFATQTLELAPKIDVAKLDEARMKLDSVRPG